VHFFSCKVSDEVSSKVSGEVHVRRIFLIRSNHFCYNKANGWILCYDETKAGLSLGWTRVDMGRWGFHGKNPPRMANTIQSTKHFPTSFSLIFPGVQTWRAI
jgi:hypothetical protein